MSVQLHALDTAGQQAWEMTLAKNVGDMLAREYPDYLWAVSVRGGVLHFKMLYASGKWGYTIRIPKIATSSELERKAKMGAGELLERYRLNRTKFNVNEYAALPKNFAGHFAFDK